MHKYKELEVWKKSIDLGELAYPCTSNFPDSEKFGLTNQIRRSAISVASNIAEAAGRNGKKEFAQFLGYAYGSSCELETQLILAEKIGYLNMSNKNMLINLIDIIQKMIFRLKKSLE